MVASTTRGRGGGARGGSSRGRGGSTRGGRGGSLGVSGGVSKKPFTGRVRGRGGSRGGSRGRGGGRGGLASNEPPGGKAALGSGKIVAKSLKQKMRDLDRFLARGLPDDVAAAMTAKRVKLAAALSAKEKRASEREWTARFRKVRFYERKKVLRQIEAKKKAIGRITSKASAENEGGRMDGSQTSRVEELNAEIRECQVDLVYLDQFPKTMSYISLHVPPKKPGAEETRTELRAKAKALLEKGGPKIAAIVSANAAVDDLQDQAHFIRAKGSDDESGESESEDGDDDLSGRSALIGELEKEDLAGLELAAGEDPDAEAEKPGTSANATELGVDDFFMPLPKVAKLQAAAAAATTSTGGAGGGNGETVVEGEEASASGKKKRKRKPRAKKIDEGEKVEKVEKVDVEEDVVMEEAAEEKVEEVVAKKVVKKEAKKETVVKAAVKAVVKEKEVVKEEVKEKEVVKEEVKEAGGEGDEGEGAPPAKKRKRVRKKKNAGNN